jgi:polar amino acid transport system substrate-binding protein
MLNTGPRRPPGPRAPRALLVAVAFVLALVVGGQAGAQDTAPPPPPAPAPGFGPHGDALAAAKARGYLRWGADKEGGAPYVFLDIANPDQLLGFEVDIARALGEELGLEVRFVHREWANLYDDVLRGDIDLAMNGCEATAESRERVAFTRPYYYFSEQLVVRTTDDRIRSLKDLQGRPAGTLAGSLAERMLQKAGAEVRGYPGQIEPFEELKNGRVDAVLLDLPIVKRFITPELRPDLRWVGPPIGRGEYAIAVKPGQEPLRAALDAALGELIHDGRLAKIFRRWDLWDDRQWSLVHPQEAGQLTGLFDEARHVLEDVPTVGPAVPAEPGRSWIARFGPLLLQSAFITLQISVLAMALAIALGVPMAVARLYGAPPLQWASAAYVELFRGTPVILQLYIIYYGLPHLHPALELSPIFAAVLGLGLNYAAYEAEIYRAGLQAIPRGQMEAALALGLTRGQSIRRILLPQAARLVIPPVTNDFVALLKDTSVVSVIAIVELTKQFYILGRSDVSHFVHFAIATAVLYLAMSYPLSAWARSMEKKLAGEAK